LFLLEIKTFTDSTLCGAAFNIVTLCISVLNEYLLYEGCVWGVVFRYQSSPVVKVSATRSTSPRSSICTRRSRCLTGCAWPSAAVSPSSSSLDVSHPVLRMISRRSHAVPTPRYLIDYFYYFRSLKTGYPMMGGLGSPLTNRMPGGKG